MTLTVALILGAVLWVLVGCLVARIVGGASDLGREPGTLKLDEEEQLSQVETPASPPPTPGRHAEA